MGTCHAYAKLGARHRVRQKKKKKDPPLDEKGSEITVVQGKRVLSGIRQVKCFRFRRGLGGHTFSCVKIPGEF